MPTSKRDDRLQQIVLKTFHQEINALKPGNVSCYAAGHGMSMADFIKSAELVSPILCQEHLSVGQRILDSVSITMREVGCNTNLGMILLFAPLLFAVQHGDVQQKLRQRLSECIDGIDEKDSEAIFKAITIAAPGGLGHSEQYDVHLYPKVKIKIAMDAAQHWDRIAYQYVSCYEDILNFGVSCINDFVLRWNSVEWAAVNCYMAFLAKFRDSHIQRKYGIEQAEEIRQRAGAIASSFKQSNRPESEKEKLLEFDKVLKEEGINPGTTADLTAASILAYHLDKNNF